MGSIEILKEIYQKLETDCLSSLRTLKLKDSFWESRDEIHKAILKQEVGIIIERNTTHRNDRVIVHHGRSPGLWLRTYETKSGRHIETY